MDNNALFSGLSYKLIVKCSHIPVCPVCSCAVIIKVRGSAAWQGCRFPHKFCLKQGKPPFDISFFFFFLIFKPVDILSHKCLLKIFSKTFLENLHMNMCDHDTEGRHQWNNLGKLFKFPVKTIHCLRICQYQGDRVNMNTPAVEVLFPLHRKIAVWAG